MIYFLSLFLFAQISAASSPAPSAMDQPEPQSLRQTDDPSKVRISVLHTIFERDRNHVTVSQILDLDTAQDQAFSSPLGYEITLPGGASAIRAMNENDARLKIRPDRVVVIDPIAPDGIRVSFQFELPIEEGKVVLEQNLKGPIALSQAVSTWTQGDVEIQGSGFGPSALRSPGEGLSGLVVVGRNIDGEHLSIVVSGLADGPESRRRNLTFVLCTAFLVAGFGAWLRRRIAGNSGSDDTTGATRA